MGTTDMRRLRLLHAIHDFLPRHQAGSEIYAFELARALSKRHDVFVVAAEYDPATPHGTLRWRAYEGLTVIEVVNNWEFDRFEESYSSPRINAQLGHVLDATRPDVLHVHNLLNLSFDLPRLARARGAASVATLHDYTLVCATGGQRVHVPESHVCRVIDPARCARCFGSSPLGTQMAAGRLVRRAGGRTLARAAAALRTRMPLLATAAVGRLPRAQASTGDLSRRIAYGRHVFDTIDLFVAPSAALGDEYRQLGLDASRLQVSDYGFNLPAPLPRDRTRGALRIGFVGTLVWHKGVHVLLEAVRGLRGAFEVRLHGNVNVFPDYTQRLRTMAVDLPVEFVGGFPRAAVAEIYRELDVLVVPSLWPENSPLVIHEAFAYGVAVVGANQGGIPGLVADGRNGLIYDTFAADALRAALQRLVDEPALATRFAAAAPPIKSIEQDAREWEIRYDQLESPSRKAAPVVPA
jgi:glycosyltransferase involved in cell wall biosynthesis